MATPPATIEPATVRRSQFPKDFAFGSATSAFQIEGALDKFGRGASIWDTFAKERGLFGDLNPDTAVGHYYRYKEDVGIMKNMRFDSYRFSISWTRIIPTGKVAKGVNREGIKFYNNLINELLAKGIKPYVTLLHFDPPQALENEYLGFLNRKIVEDFRDYAEVCFREFGDRVKQWITINEAHSFCYNGYATGVLAPGRGGLPDIKNVERFLPPDFFSTPGAIAAARQKRQVIIGDPAVEPYQAAHNHILAHAAVVKLYREKYQAQQKGSIGITHVSPWYEPYSGSDKDKAAALRAMDFYFGWFLSPITTGDYPASMREYVKERLPVFSKEETGLIIGSYDFIGINYYTARYAKDAKEIMEGYPAHYVFDPRVEFLTERGGVVIGPPGGSEWMYVYPKGIYNLLIYTRDGYKNPTIYITENGMDELNDPSLPPWDALFDVHRISYLSNHLQFVKEAINQKVKVKGYFTWSLLDNFEWAYGFNIRFGINFVDYRNGSTRLPKLGAGWMRFFLEN